MPFVLFSGEKTLERQKKKRLLSEKLSLHEARRKHRAFLSETEDVTFQNSEKIERCAFGGTIVKWLRSGDWGLTCGCVRTQMSWR